MNYDMDIEIAKSNDIDGFALNCGYDYDSYTDRFERFFEFANRLNFGLVLSIDTDSFLKQYPTDHTRHMVAFYEKYRNKISYMKYKGKSLVTTFGGDNIDWTDFKSQTDAYLIVNFFGKVPEKNLKAVDGVFAWPPPSLSNEQELYLGGVGKTFMTFITPAFDVDLPSKNYSVPFHIVNRWKAALSLNPAMVQLVSWNDFTESTHFIDPGPGTVTIPEHQYDPKVQHRGFLELSKHFISLYKHGRYCDLEFGLYVWYNKESFHVYLYVANVVLWVINGPFEFHTSITERNWYMFDFETRDSTILVFIDATKHTISIQHTSMDYSVQGFKI